MTGKVLNRCAVLLPVLLLVLTTLATAAVTKDNDLVFDVDVETPLIEKQRPQSIFHRIKRSLWNLFGGESEPATTGPPETPAEPDNQQTGFDVDPSQSTDEEDAAGQQTDYDDENEVNPSISPERKTRESGEDPNGNVFSNSVDGGDDEDTYGGSGDVEYEGSATGPGIDRPIDSNSLNVPFTVNEPVPIPGPTSGPAPEGPKNLYRATMIISEPYRPDLEDRESAEFRELSGQLSKAIDELYENALGNRRTRSTILKFLQTSDPVATQVSLDIESNAPEESMRSILVDQLELHTLGTIQVRPDGFSFKKLEDDRSCDPESELACQSDGQCIPIGERCDGVTQCSDGSDETNCTPPTTTTITETPIVPSEPPTTESVDTTTLPPITSPLPTLPTVQCRGDQTILCKDGSRCFGSIQQCDGVQDCDDNSDEEGCPPLGCQYDEFACDESRCIEKVRRCDFRTDCDDGSDELSCPTPPECALDQFKCKNGQCIEREKLCDEKIDCYDQSDEVNCNERICSPESEWACRNGRCIEKSLKCNGLDDCGDRSDEQTCPCTGAQFKCDNGFCIPKERRCDKYNDCQDKSDERDCATPPPTCREQEFECDNGECIDENLVCDYRADCADSSDERDCRPEQVCSPDQFKCNDGTCLSGTARCNSIRECANGEDEHQCGCGISEFRCMDGSCIPDNLVCDRSDDCPDGSDEGCDPCKLASPTSVNLIRCHLRLDNPLCKTVIVTFPPLRTIGDTNSNCKKLTRKHFLRKSTTPAYGNEFLNTQTTGTVVTPFASVSSTEGRDVESYENTKDDDDADPNEDIEVLELPNESKAADRSPDSGQTVKPGVQGPLDDNWEYVPNVSKGRFAKRPKLRPVEQKLLDQEVKRCRINCLRRWTRQQRRDQFDNSLEMKEEVYRNGKTIDCLERAGSRSDEENCFNIDMILRTLILGHLRSGNNGDPFDPSRRSENKSELRQRRTRGTKANDYFWKYRIREKFTPASTKATTAAPIGVGSVTEKRIASKNSIWTHEAFRERVQLEVLYYNECEVDCSRHFAKLYDGRSGENSGERRSDKGERTTTEERTEGTTTTEMTRNSSDETLASWFPSSNENEVATSRSRESSPEGGQSHEKNPVEEASGSDDSRREWESGVTSREKLKDRNSKGAKGTKGRNKCDQKSRKERRKCGRRRTTLIDTTTQPSTTEEIDEGRCPEGEHYCDKGKCVKYAQICDSRFDCADHSDESGCDYNNAVLENVDYDLSLDESGSKNDDGTRGTARGHEYQTTDEMVSTTETSGRQTVAESNNLWPFEIPPIWGGGDSVQSAGEKSTAFDTNEVGTVTEKSDSWDFGFKFPWAKDGSKKASSSRPEITTLKPRRSSKLLYGGSGNSVESYESRERNSNEISVELTREAGTTNGRNKHKGHGKRRKGGRRTTTQTPTADETDPESCPSDQQYCDKGKCVEYELVCDGKFDCEDRADEDDCDYYLKELKDFEYDPDSDGSYWKSDEKELKTTSKDSQLTTDERTTAETYGRKTVTEKKSEWGDVDPGSVSETPDDSTTSSHHPGTTTEEWDWGWGGSLFGKKNDDSKSSEDQSTGSPLSKETVTTDKHHRDFGSWSFWGGTDNSVSSASSEKLKEGIVEGRKSGEKKDPQRKTSGSMTGSGERRVKDSREDSEIIDIVGTASTSTSEPTTRDETQRTIPAHDVTTVNPKSREHHEDREGMTWTNSATSRGSVTERATPTGERLKENYNAYNVSFARREDPRNTRERGSYRQDQRRREYQRLRQQQIRKQDEAAEQRRMREEQELDRRLDEFAHRDWELKRKNQEIKEEMRRLRVEKLSRISERRRNNIDEDENEWRRWPGRRNCIGGSRRCDEAGRLTKGPADCPSMDFTCGDGSCIPQSSVCNGIDDCPVAEDELHCEIQCTVSQFRCVKDGKCINAAYRCDTTFDCPDHSDEAGCPSGPRNGTGTESGHGKPGAVDSYHTTPGSPVTEEATTITNPGMRACDPIKEFRCQNGQCIQLRRKCDIVPDCYDSSDETNCPGRCDPDQWKCANDDCIPEIQRCDNVTHCVDGSDELECVTECPTGTFRCGDGLCLDGRRHCDGTPDCRDNSDEKNCPCPFGKWPCSNGVCIDEIFRCDEHLDCLDGSDEANCKAPVEPTRPPPTCRSDEFQCSNGDCIPSSARCNRVGDCRDGGDELNCPPGCIRGEFECRNRNCVRAEQQCNQRDDCGDNSDEENCVPPCPVGEDCDRPCSANEWRCENGPCIPISQRCNNRVDCPRDNSDELDCSLLPLPSLPCSSSEWRCENGPCIPLGQRCNGRRDCPLDISDELDCPEPENPPPYPQELNLKVYPEAQVIKEKPANEGRQVVIQCRDEGSRRVRVHWIREDGAPLPPGSSDVDGRLEMPNVKVSDSGNYVCEALGVSANTPGRRVISHLEVENESPTSYPRSCREDEATCGNGDCIPRSKVCDRINDCSDGTDEIRCGNCEPNQFKCGNTECVNKVWRCDGDKDCLDGSDEQNCEPPPPGSPCRFNEYQCASDNQCILKSFHCDREQDCLDRSDEFGCTKAQILTPPTRMTILNVGETFSITCIAIGIPMPEISWRLNWGHIPEKCTTSSINGTGTLTCPSVTIEDQGAYSCEAMNTLLSVFATPDAILVVEKPDKEICRPGMFNSLARTADECISCFCFGVATKCSSADLFTYQLPTPFDQHNVVSVETYPDIRIQSEVSGTAPEIRPVGRNGVQVVNRYSNSGDANSVLYFALPESYHGSQLKSYGGYLKYSVRNGGQGRPNEAPSVILTGNNYVLIYKGENVPSDYETERTVRFFFGNWLRKQGWDEVVASREEIMMALAHVDNILIKVQYHDGPTETTIANVFVDSADVRNTNLGAATYVEECRCPVGYTGLSCEHCESGYSRRDSGQWLGQCYREEPTCPSGYYKDPSRNSPCQPCPCPLTDPSNQFAQTCHLGADGQPTCDCPQGYVGRRCEQCAPGYQGNPLSAGDSCVKVDECDPNGSISPYANPATGVCQCKALATGRTCNQCKANTFHLAASNKFGCVSCFCMGVTMKCTSSNWYRSEIHVAFTNSIRDFSLVEMKSTDPTPIVDGIHLNTINREIVYNTFPNRENNDVYYWQLPSNFVGDQLASYGGHLKYTVRYVPSPGGGRSRNSAADVVLISSNDINLRHYSGKQLEPNTAETFTVPLHEDYWQRTDGTIADREHLLMALADVQAIRIKATYTTHTNEAALSSVSLDTSVNWNTGKARAIEVEQCSCPTGYRGLSCEDCDVGYARVDEGLYLGSCAPCSCNGHSTQCDSETGICENCRDHTSGDNCESCDYDYEGDATRGSPQDCQPRNSVTEDPSCTCDPVGSLGSYCYNGQCECKANVEGPQCNRCHQFTFGLSANNVDGCTECYCSGVTNQCHESSFFIDQIPTFIYDFSHGFTLTDSDRRDVITEGFDLDTSTNTIGYRYPDSRSQGLFWSLPSAITGNQVKSYGGNLYLTQNITTRYGAANKKDQDVILIGNGISLYWTNPEEIQPGIALAYSVPLVESSWTRLTQEEGPRSASRADLMSVLSNLEAVLVRATHSSQITATYISDVSLDTAVSQPVSNRRATQVEACRCPSGYTGTSCELCATGYYRDVNDKSRSLLGACNLCPCNGNEQECKVDRSGGVKCYCLAGFSEPYCTEPGTTTTEIPVTDPPPPKIIVTISETPFQIVEVGNSVRYHCTGRSENSRSIRIEWQKESGQLPVGRSYDDERGLLVIRDLKVSDSGIYVCQVSDGVNIAIQKVTLTVGGARPTEPRPIIEPRYLTVEEGNPVEFHCTSSGNPQPQLSWIRVQGEINPAAVFENGVWSLQSARKSDEAEYKCIAQNTVGTREIRTILYVNARTVPPPDSLPIIEPADWIGGTSDTIRLVCTASRGARITWSRSNNIPLPASAIDQDGILTIHNPSPSDSGYYICTAITYEGVETRSTARVTIHTPSAGPPRVRVEPVKQYVSQGTLTEVKCIVTGDPTPVVTWTKLGQPLGAHIQTAGNTLRIVNTQVSDRGVYVCQAANSGGNAQGSATIDVNRRETPAIELFPEKYQIVPINGSALFYCRPTAGIPTPSVSWAREDGRPFSSNVVELPGGNLRFNHVTPEDGGSFICSASNEAGSVSLVAILEISTPPIITITPSNRSPLSVRLGEKVRLTCAASGQPQPTVKWNKYTAGISPFGAEAESRLSVAVYEISSVSYQDEGSYTCLATNAYGPVQERIQIRVEENLDESEAQTPSPNVNGAGVGVTIPEESLRIPNGGKVEIRCQVYGSDREAIYLDWKRSDGQSLPQRSTVRSGTLLIPAVTKDDAGEYICQGLNNYGHVLFTATSYLEIISPPRIELDPIQQVVRPGDSPSVTCRVTGDQPIDIEWHAIDRPLPYTVTQDRGFLQFNRITSDDAGKYVCKATNNAGTAEAVAEVLINEYIQPNAPTSQRDINTYVGSSVRLDCPGDSRSSITWNREGGNLPRNSIRRGNILELTEVRSEDGGRYICQVTNESGASSRNYINLRVEFYGVRCGNTESQCHSGECIDRLYLCDGTIDCIDGSDEQYCLNRYYRHYPQRKRAQTVAVNLRIRASQDLVNIGDTIDIQCDASGAQNPRFTWTKLNEPSLPQNAQARGPILRLSRVAMGESGIYRCTAVTTEGSFEKDYELIIQGGNNDAPAVETKSAPYGSKVVMNCGADIDPPIKFQWHKLSGGLPINSVTSNNQLELLDVKAEDAGTYICTASNGQANIEVPQVLVVTGVVPNFSQAPQSYTSFAPLPDSSLQFNIEVSFKPESYDGIILYNGQYNNGTGDYLLLSLVGGYPEFRFNLGSGPAVIRGQRPITLGTWHTIKLQRTHKEGTMLVDGEGPYTAIAGGKFQTLDLWEPLYVGGVPDYNAISQQVDVNSGFVGCISKLLINDNDLDLIGDQLSSVGVTTCETCAENPCSNNGVCQEAATENGYTCLCPAGYSGKHCANIGQACYPDACGEGTCYDRDDGFVCTCPIGKGGSRCEIDVNVVEPGFHDRDAYLAYQSPRAFRKIKLAMKFKPSDAGNGILMYCSQSNDGLGDFIALIIKDRYVEFRFDLGSGMAVVRSNHIVRPGVWLHLQASRDAREGRLSINDEPQVIGRSPGPVKSMTLNTLLYIGGVNRHKVTVNKNVGVERNFRGCISELDIAGQPIDILRSVVDSSNIKDCLVKYSNPTEPSIYESTPVATRPPTSPPTTEFDPCTLSPCIHGSCQLTNTRDYSCMCEYGYVGRNCENILKQCELLNPCRNGGICTDFHGGYKCDCQLGFNGHRCETPVEISNDVAFRGDGWLELERSVMTHEEEKEVLGFEISTNKSTGVIMWHGQTPTDLSPDDYISLAVVDGYVEYQYNLGSGPAVIRVTAQRVDDGERHRIVLKRQGSEGSIELNGEHTESGASDGLQQLLNARGSVYLGGVPDYAMTYGRYEDGFSGCIYTLEVQDSGAIVIGDKVIRGRNVYPCTSEFDRPPIRGDGGHVQR